jgi:hypothetical protein
MFMQNKLTGSHQILAIQFMNYFASIYIASAKVQESFELFCLEIFNEYMLFTVCSTLPLFT